MTNSCRFWRQMSSPRSANNGATLRAAPPTTKCTAAILPSMRRGSLTTFRRRFWSPGSIRPGQRVRAMVGTRSCTTKAAGGVSRIEWYCASWESLPRFFQYPSVVNAQVLVIVALSCSLSRVRLT